MGSQTPSHPILNGLNDAQRRAVTSEAATVAILAGPGSGKTHTLTARVVWLVDHQGIRPEDVIVATFTVKAAREMKERIGKALGNGRENKLILGTFHSIARRYLAAYGRHIGLNPKFGIADANDSSEIIKRICKRLQLAIDPAGARAWISKKKSKGNEATPKSARQEASKTAGLQELDTCYHEYQKHLEASNLLDYDDLLVKCVDLLRKFPSSVSNIQTVLIDEYQDTNGVQYDLMKLFAQHRQRITTVGDPDQSIYGWRSAEIRNLWKMLREYPQTDEISLEENYRSSQAILDLSLEIIKQDQKRYNKALKPTHNKGSRPVLRRLKSASAEADWIVSEIRRVLVMSGDMLTHNDVAILLRSAALSRHIETSLGKAGIPYRMVGGFKFYERAEIKVLIDYLRVIHQPKNNDALANILNVPRRGIGESSIKGLLEEAETSSLSLWDVLTKHCRGDRTAKTKLTKQAEQQLSGSLLRPLQDIRRRIDEANGSNQTPFGLVEMIEQLLAKLNFQEHLKKKYPDPDDHGQRWANVQEFVNLAAEFERDMRRSNEDELPEIEGLDQTRETEALPRFLANVALASDAQTKDDEGQRQPLVTISTIHAAKGLEWPIVFVPAVYDGSIPHTRAEDGDEERRLLYVAMTRAQSLLYLSWPLFGANGNGERNQLSPFIEPASRFFMSKGPCLDRPVMAEIARILRRKLPSERLIYSSLPAMFSPEDDLFPVEPEEASKVLEHEFDRQLRRYLEEVPRTKRPRLYGPLGGQDDGEEVPWMRHTTAVEQVPASFKASMPGFVTVGAHQAAITAANTAAMAAQKTEKSKPLTNKRPSGQTSILGFVKTHSAPTRTRTEPPVDSRPSNAISARSRFEFEITPKAASVQPAIDPGLAGHKLRAGILMSRPSVPNDEEPVKKKQYACFSSSPPRAAAMEDTKYEGSSTAQPDNGGMPPPGSTRPATCLHATSSGIGSVFRKPQGLGQRTLAPLETLRKPFKPLSMNRSS
ncbi:P-loop containing nucleoside triphosphate hydrolase protein [Corynascus novoguineensis]|uniref:DNA 3'-5' helicase n=1 Tax=Corynascus novoguineensis TaxID=1126955 RepID=A0AAN7CYA9_9PEZI|nr:P-loop containing nucleoside triphosphate hydrolase protein [Corynascus novoguineensis]